MLIHEIPSPGYGKIDGRWYVCVPGERRAAPLSSAHTVTEHEDGTISVRPSLLTARWHGWLNHGEFLGLSEPIAV